MGPEEPRQPDRPEELEVEALLPQLVGELDKRAALGGTGAVDEDVDVVEGSCRLTMQLLTSFERRQVGWDRLDPAPGGGRDLFGGRLERVSGASRDDDIGAFIGQPAGDPLADPAASAGDHRDLAFQLHNSSGLWSERG